MMYDDVLSIDLKFFLLIVLLQIFILVLQMIGWEPGEAYDQVKEMCIFLLNELALPAGKALAVYVQSPGSQYEYRGAVHSACPSAVFPLLWPITVAIMVKCF
jgi:hypothetical protein